MPLVTLVIGLPASGKSTFLESYIRDGIPVFDDFMKDSPPGGFRDCQHLNQIEAHLVDGRDIVLADVRLTEPEFYGGVVSLLGSLVTELRIRNVYFANNPAQCLANSAKRAAQQLENHKTELRRIPAFSANYSIPAGAEVVPVAAPGAPKPGRNR